MHRRQTNKTRTIYKPRFPCNGVELLDLYSNSDSHAERQINRFAQQLRLSCKGGEIIYLHRSAHESTIYHLRLSRKGVQLIAQEFELSRKGAKLIGLHNN